MQKPTITLEQMELLDIRLCLIESVTDILKKPKKEPGADNPVVAYHLVINTGFDVRDCVTNIVHVPKENLVGISTPFILNLEPREVRGVLSKAMIVASEVEGHAQVLGFKSGLNALGILI